MVLLLFISFDAARVRTLNWLIYNLGHQRWYTAPVHLGVASLLGISQQMGSSHSLAHRGAILPFCWFFFLRGWITFFKVNISLPTLDISGWNNVTHVGTCFLSKCTALQTLDLSGLTTVQHIGKRFLKGCKIPTSSINITGSSSVVSDKMDKIKHKCVCM